MKLPFPFKTKRARPPFCPFHRCVNGCPKTLSFRAENDTISEPVTFNPTETFTKNDPITWSNSERYEEDHHVEDVVRGLRSSERLVFEPGERKSSKLLEEEGVVEAETVVSRNPFEDFRRSMEEMVEAHADEGVVHHQQEFLEELLACYLRINGREHHGYIVGAFVDLLVHLSSNGDHHHCLLSSSSESSSSSSESSTSSASPLSFCSTVRPSTATA